MVKHIFLVLVMSVGCVRAMDPTSAILRRDTSHAIAPGERRRMDQEADAALDHNQLCLARSLMQCNVGWLDILLESGVDVNKPFSENTPGIGSTEITLFYSRTPLQIALAKEHYSQASLLLAKGASPNVHDERTLNDTPLHTVMRSLVAQQENAYRKQDFAFHAPDRFVEFMCLLVCRGADISAVNALKQTIFHVLWTGPHQGRVALYQKCVGALIASQKVVGKDHALQRARYASMANKIRETVLKQDKCDKSVLDLVCYDLFCDHTNCRAKETIWLQEGRLEEKVEQCMTEIK